MTDDRLTPLEAATQAVSDALNGPFTPEQLARAAFTAAIVALEHDPKKPYVVWVAGAWVHKDNLKDSMGLT